MAWGVDVTSSIPSRVQQGRRNGLGCVGGLGVGFWIGIRHTGSPSRSSRIPIAIPRSHWSQDRLALELGLLLVEVHRREVAVLHLLMDRLEGDRRAHGLGGDELDQIVRSHL